MAVHRGRAPRWAIAALPGGNPQKVLLARAPQMLLLQDSTRGVDVARRLVLYDLFRDPTRAGVGLVVLSTEIEEVLLLCDRVRVFRDHQIAADRTGDAVRSDVQAGGMTGHL